MTRQRSTLTTTQRGYGYSHQKMRAQAIAAFRPGDPCSRCGRPMMGPPTTLELDHDDTRQGYRGLSHRRCNRAAGARKLNAIKRRRTQPSRW